MSAYILRRLALFVCADADWREHCRVRAGATAAGRSDEPSFVSGQIIYVAGGSGG